MSDITETDLTRVDLKNLMAVWTRIAELVQLVTGDVKVTVDGNLQEQIEKLKESGTNITVDSELSSTSENPVQNKAVKAALDGKAPSSHGTHSWQLWIT